MRSRIYLVIITNFNLYDVIVFMIRIILQVVDILLSNGSYLRNGTKEKVIKLAHMRIDVGDAEFKNVITSLISEYQNFG